MDTTLILVGIACIIGAIVGGGVKLVQVELSPVASLWRQLMLGAFGIVLVVSGLAAGGHLGSRAPAELAAGGVGPAPAATGPATAQTRPPPAAPPEPAPADDADQSAPQAPRSAEVALPGKVDVFWCGPADGEELAGRIAAALRDTGRIGRVRVRPLSANTNAGPDYGIDRNIVRFDPGEQPAAEALARQASAASGLPFAAAHALPGSPSVDYLSVFACGPR